MLYPVPRNNSPIERYTGASEMTFVFVKLLRFLLYISVVCCILFCHGLYHHDHNLQSEYHQQWKIHLTVLWISYLSCYGTSPAQVAPNSNLACLYLSNCHEHVLKYYICLVLECGILCLCLWVLGITCALALGTCHSWPGLCILVI